MAPTSIRMAIVDQLENLSKDNVEKFCHQLIHRRGEPRIRRNKVDGKSLREITDALVNAFTESGALEVTLEILKNIDCREDADELEEAARNLTKTRPQDAVDGMGSSESTAVSFIRGRKTKLITCLGADLFILQHAQQEDVITLRDYRRLKSISSNDDAVKELLDVVMEKGDGHCRRFLQILKEHDVVETYPTLKEIMKDWK